MNRFRDLVEHVAARAMLIPDTWADADAEAVCDFVLRNSESAMCFYVGDPAVVDGIKAIVGAAETPSPVCWYECEFVAEDCEHVVLGLLTVHNGTQYQHVAFRRKRGVWMLRHTVSQVDANTMQVSPPEAAQEAEQLVILRNVVISSMRCANITKVEHQPDHKLQRRRAADGKRPLFSYWTLHIKAERNESVGCGGSHALPRLHIRRGHIREYKPGLHTWVQACLVGNGERGYVHKDYNTTAVMAGSQS